MISLGKLAYYIAYPGLRLFSSRISKQRVRVIIYSPAGNILLVKSWFGRQRWSLPGGGIERNESPEAATVRELLEETSLRVQLSELELLGEMKGEDGLPFNLLVYKVRVSNEQLPPLARGRDLEITDRKWFSPDKLPADVSPAVHWALRP